MLEQREAIIMIFLIFSSFIFFASTIIGVCLTIFKRKSHISRIVNAGLLGLLFFLSIFLLRLSIGYCEVCIPSWGREHLTIMETCFNSFFESLRTFAMEESYFEFIVGINKAVDSIILFYDWDAAVRIAIDIYASIVHVIAPIVGAAMILEMLSSIFPKIRLWVARYLSFRPKYYFSKLNSTSLSLAKSIYKSERKTPILIFTDAYVDNEREKEYELLLGAKRLGGICLKDDLAHVAKKGLGARKYFLVDENEFCNLQALMGVAKERNLKYIKKSQIYLLVQTDSYIQIEKQIEEKLEKQIKEKLKNQIEKKLENQIEKKDDEKCVSGQEEENKKEKVNNIRIIPVNAYRNLVRNLFYTVPLYEPLINKEGEDRKKLNLTIFGNGIIGTEAFLNAYWFGQMMVSSGEGENAKMSECEMTVTVVSKDSEDEFWSKIDYVNPEIKRTVRILSENGCIEDKEFLRYSDTYKASNPPYCTVRYIKSDVKIGGFWDADFEERQHLLNSDYFIVALGSDSDNISIAEKLKRYIGKGLVENNNGKKTVIAYAVFDSAIANELNSNRAYRVRNDEACSESELKTYDIYMYAFGSLDSMYSHDNIYMSRQKLLEEIMNSSENAVEDKKHKRGRGKKTKQKNEDPSNYDYWARLARFLHIKYKVFSLGWIKKSIFDCELSNLQKHSDYVNKKCKIYVSIACGTDLDPSNKYVKDIERKKHVLAWLEHRRWVAFTRTMGLQHVSAQNILDTKLEQKDTVLKIHSCLVEARRPKLIKDDSYIYAKFSMDGKIDESTMFQDYPDDEFLDYLDKASKKRYKAKKLNRTSNNRDDFKKNDYYRYESLDLEENNQNQDKNKQSSGG